MYEIKVHFCNEKEKIDIRIYIYIKRDREILIRENIRTAQDRNDLFNRSFGRTHNSTVF
jgi:hypothetical protein